MDTQQANDWLALAQGDADTWRRFLHEQIPRLYGFFLNRWRNHALAEELVQKTVFDAVKGLSTFDADRGGGDDWLFGIARNNIRLEIRRRASRPAVNGDVTAYIDRIDGEELPDEVIERAETAELVRSAMARLDEKERRALTAMYVEDMSARQIAQSMSLTEKAVHSLLYRARLSLRDQLKNLASFHKEAK